MNDNPDETTMHERFMAISQGVHRLLADIKEKNTLIDAGETHGAEWARREDDLGECQQILEEMEKLLDRLDIIL